MRCNPIKIALVNSFKSFVSRTGVLAIDVSMTGVSLLIKLEAIKGA